MNTKYSKSSAREGLETNSYKMSYKDIFSATQPKMKKINKTLILIAFLAIPFAKANAGTAYGKNKNRFSSPVSNSMAYTLIVGTVGGIFFFNRNKLSGKPK